MKKSSLLICAIVLFFVSPLHAVDKQALINGLRQHDARALSTWSGYIGKDIKDRILPAPDLVIDYLRKDNQLQGFSEQPQRAEIDIEFLRDIVSGIQDLPKPVRSHIHDHVIAVFLVEKLGGTAYVELLRDFENNRLGFIVLDIGALNRKSNEWASWKENSPFDTKGGYAIEAEIERKGNDHRMAAVQYIFLHELGHLVGVAKGAHPNWFVGGNPQEWPFTKLSWLTVDEGSSDKSRFDDAFPSRRKIRFYSFSNPSLTSEAIEETYAHLLKTDFVSLYAATNMYDDFAETYAMYVHVVLQDRPWKVRIVRAGKMVKEIVNPILDPRCGVKKRYLDSLFEQPM